jgi:hypothetical protein
MASANVGGEGGTEQEKNDAQSERQRSVSHQLLLQAGVLMLGKAESSYRMTLCESLPALASTSWGNHSRLLQYTRCAERG